MGSICSCFCVDDLEEYRNSYGSVHRHRICLRFLAQQMMHMYSLVLQSEDHRQPPSSLDSVAATSDDSFSGTFLSAPRPLPYDDPRCSRLHNAGLTTAHDKPLNHVDEESQLLSRVKNYCRTESTSIATKWSGYSNVVSRKGCLEHPSIEITGGVAYLFPSSEEEDVCPTCLEEYTFENPRIILQCSHHFHLGCIYEWMERSELCPVCGKNENQSFPEASTRIWKPSKGVKYLSEIVYSRYYKQMDSSPLTSCGTKKSHIVMGAKATSIYNWENLPLFRRN